MAARLQFYFRHGCHLCEQMLSELRGTLTAQEFADIEYCDVDSQRVWFDQYDQLVPVLLLDGREVARYFLDQPELRTILNSHAK